MKIPATEREKIYLQNKKSDRGLVHAIYNKLPKLNNKKTDQQKWPSEPDTSPKIIHEWSKKCKMFIVGHRWSGAYEAGAQGSVQVGDY